MAIKQAMTRRGAAVLLGGLIILAGCHSKPHHFHLTDVSQGHEADLQLPVHQTAAGKPISAQRLRGRWVVLYFGYTHCPNICPVTLAKLNAALKSLKPKQAAQITVLFASVDPKRDGRRLLVRYVHAFNPGFEAIRPPAKALPRFTRRYHISYSYGKPDAQGNYTVSHSSEFIVFGPQGHMRLMGNYQSSVKDIADDLRYLVARS
jgi:protein SCO1/2